MAGGTVWIRKQRMGGARQLTENATATPDGAPQPADPRLAGVESRRLWEAQERMSELESQLAERLERERILELEVSALRRDLAVKVSYTDALERSLEEQQATTRWLQERFDEERRRADALSAELAAERARISYRLVNRAIKTLRRG
jgi:flagellar biosynthesis chaperone FliJ